MKLTNRRITRILANAPDRATHYDTCCDEYLNYDVDQAYTEVGWVNVCIDAYADPSKLSDLEKILELLQRVQELKDGMVLTPCYECGAPVHELSPRSRCCKCEYDRANFNEKENNQLREQLE